MSTFDLGAVRRDTPAAEAVLHFNNAGAALPPHSVTQAITDYLAYEAKTGGYEAAADRDPITSFRAAAARLLGAQPHQLAFTTSATDAYNRALSAIPWRAGDLIITTEYDYSSNQIAFLQLAKTGVRTLRAGSRADGAVAVDELHSLVRTHGPRLVSVTHVPSNRGLVQDVVEIGAVCRELGVLYLVDACQSVGQLPLDVQAIGCDFLSATGRKFLRGPRGTGLLYVSDRILEGAYEPRFLDLYSATWLADEEYQPQPDARRFEQYERNYALVSGLTAAIDYALALDVAVIHQRIVQLTTLLRDALLLVPGLRVQEVEAIQTGILTCGVSGTTGDFLVNTLRQHGLNAAWAPNDPLHRASGGPDWILRLSPHYYNTEEEVARAVEVIRQVLRGH